MQLQRSGTHTAKPKKPGAVAWYTRSHSGQLCGLPGSSGPSQSGAAGIEAGAAASFSVSVMPVDDESALRMTSLVAIAGVLVSGFDLCPLELFMLVLYRVCGSFKGSHIETDQKSCYNLEI